jgi:murein L,D-transpeptidase YafK
MKYKLFIIVFVITILTLIFYKLLFTSPSTKETSSQLMKADKVLVEKSKRKMYLINNGKVFRSYTISLGKDPVGDKQKEGDNKTPEGIYVLDWRNNKSSCYKSIHISYPDDQDVSRAKKAKVEPGGNIMIHGLHPSLKALGKFHTAYDWTNGCVAVTNEEMDDIWKSVKYGTIIEIRK